MQESRMTVLSHLATEKPRSNADNPRARQETVESVATPAPVRIASDSRSVRSASAQPQTERIAKPVLMDPSSPLLHQVSEQISAK
jgi:hypothetical protein